MNAVAGLIVPIITPLTENQQVDEKAFASLSDRLVRSGVDVMFALGTTGEFYGLTCAQKQTAVDVVLESVAGRVPIIVGISGESTATALANYQACRRDGIAGYVTSTPYFLGYTQEELADHFRRLANRIGQPLILYNYPARYRHRIDIPTVASLADEGLISSIKDTDGDFNYLCQLLEIKRSYPKLGVFDSALQNLARSAPLGIDGTVQALANLFPAEFAAVWKAICSCEWDAVTRQASRLWDFLVAMEKVAPFIAALKGSMGERSWCSAAPAWPTRAVSDAERHELATMLNKFLASEHDESNRR